VNAEFDKMLNAVLFDRAVRRVQSGLEEAARLMFQAAQGGNVVLSMMKRLSQVIFYADIERRMASAKKIARFMFGGFSR